MCIICKTSDISTLVNLTELYCACCPLLTSIPNTLVNLTHLNCACCHLLTSIPSTLVNLRFLWCADCRLLIDIPDTLVNLQFVDFRESPWINYKDIKNKNVSKLITLQRFVKGYIKSRIFSRWIKSREGVEWIYHSDNIGGKIAKRSIEKMFE